VLYILAFRFVATEYDSILMDTQIATISGWTLILQTFILLDGVRKQVTSFIHLKVLLVLF